MKKKGWAGERRQYTWDKQKDHQKNLRKYELERKTLLWSRNWVLWKDYSYIRRNVA